MKWMWQQFRAVSARVARRVVPGCALVGGPLLMLLMHATIVPAQESGTQRWTGGPRPSTETPGERPRFQLQRYPSRGFGGDDSAHDVAVRLAAAEVESLPPPTTPSPLSAPRVEGTLPIAGWDADVNISQGPGGRIDRLVVRDASLSKVLSLLAQTYHLNIVASNDIDAVISITLRDVALEEALTAILSVANYTWVNRDGIILITSLSDAGQLPPEVQGRQLQVFDLDFASATELSEAVTAFLSPIGKMSIATSDPTDNRRTREMIVVEDIPEAIARIASYIYQVDCPPRQVLIEAHILQVTLKDNEKNGVNFNALARIAGADVHFKTVGFANPLASPAFLTTVDGSDLTAVIELLQSTTDTKTLGSPKVLVLNQQTARVHVGEDLGYQTTVTSEIQSTQAPQFLQVGVILELTPRITRDNRVLLHVEPQVSTGVIDPITQVPNKKTTELTTDVMLNDGEAVVIGGLIDEQDSTLQSKIPYLGDMWRVGFLFRKSDVTKERKEVIFALVPRIQPYAPDYQDFEDGEAIKAQTPLFQGPLCYTDRPFEARLADGKRVVKPYIPPPAIRPRVDRSPCDYCESPWPPYYVPPKPYPEQHLVDEFADDYSGQYSDGCVAPGPTQPGSWSQPQISGEFVPEFGGYDSGDIGEEGSIISDQP